MLAALAKGSGPGRRTVVPRSFLGPTGPGGAGGGRVWGGARWKVEPARRAGQGCKAPQVLEVMGGSPSGLRLELGLGVRARRETSRTGRAGVGAGRREGRRGEAPGIRGMRRGGGV